MLKFLQCPTVEITILDAIMLAGEKPEAVIEMPNKRNCIDLMLAMLVLCFNPFSSPIFNLIKYSFLYVFSHPF